ncbi:hypothetical protein UlMin_012288 [Ulmus minor]
MNTYCKSKECKKHNQHKVTQYKKGKDSLAAWGKRCYDHKQSGYGGQTCSLSWEQTSRKMNSSCHFSFRHIFKLWFICVLHLLKAIFLFGGDILFELP